MKQFRKMLALLLALAMSISIMAAPSYAAEDKAKTELAVKTSAEEGADLKSGDTLTATITAPAPSEAVANGQLQMNFNKDILQVTETGLTGHKGTLVLSSADDANKNGFINAMFYDAGGDNTLVLTDPAVLTVKFTVKEKVYEGSYEDLITVDKEKTFFSKADDSKVEEEFGNTSFDADLDGEWHLVIPEGATFDEIWTDIDTDTEKARINITDTGLKFDGNGPIYVITVPKTVHKVYFKWIKAAGKPCIGWGVGTGWEYPQQKSPQLPRVEDCVNNDEYQQIGIDPSTAMLEDYNPDDAEDDQMKHVYKFWSDSWGNLVGLTFEYSCAHEHVDHIEAVAPKCTSAGNIEYWKCNDCKRLFSDKKLKKRISEAQTVIDPLPHEYGEDQVCTMCKVRGTTKVNFIGGVPSRVTDKSADTENSGLDYKFKVSKKSVVCEAMIPERASKIELDPVTTICNYNGQSYLIYKLEDVKYNGVTVPNYSFHSGGAVTAINKNDANYDLVKPDGTKTNKSQTSGRRFSTEGQYFLTKAGTDEPVAGIIYHKDNNEEIVKEPPMEADEDGFYTIPSAKMIADKTVNISVDKWYSSTVKFTGNGAYKVTDATSQSENAGEDFKFKAGNGIVTMDPGEAAGTPEHIFVDGQENVKFYPDDSIEVDDKTIPAYNMYFTGTFWLNGDNYDFEDDPDDEDNPLSYCGTAIKKDGQYYALGCNKYDTAKIDGQYLVYETKYTRGKKVVEDGDYWYEYDEIEKPLFAINVIKGEPGTMVPDDEGFYTIPGSKMKPDGTITVNVVKPPSSFVEFVGDGAYKVTDATEQDENAGKDFKFKAGDGIVSYDVEIVDTPVDVLNITNPENLTFVKKGTVKIKGDDEDVPVEKWAEYDVPDYDVYVSGSFKMDHKRVGGVDSDKYENRIYRSNRIDKYTETPVTGAGGEYIVFYEHDIQGSHSGGWYRKEFKPLFRMKVVEGSPVLTPDEKGFYTIPGKEMKPNETIRIRVLKQEYEKVENKIDEIGEVTLESEEAIAAARGAYEALSDEQKALVSNTHMMKLEDAEQELALLKKKEEKPDLADLIDAQIKAIKDTEERIAAVNAEIDALKKSDAANKDKIAELENTASELKSQLTNLQNAVKDLQDTIATKTALDTAIETLEGKIAALKGDPESEATVAGLEKELKDIKTAVAGLTSGSATKDQLTAAVNELTGKITALDSRVKTLEDSVATKTALNEAIETLEGKIAALKGDPESKATVAGLEKELEDLKTAVAGLTSSSATKDQLTAAVNELTGKITALDTRIKDLEDTIATKTALNEAIETLEGKIAALKGEGGNESEATIVSLEKELNGLRTAVTALATKEELKNQIQALNDQITSLTSQINELKNANGANKDLDAMKAKAADDINKYLENNTANILPGDLLSAEVAVLQSIIKVDKAKDEAGIKAAVDTAIAVIDEKVQIKKDTVEAKALKVTGLKATSKNKKFSVSWKKNADADAYQVQYKLSSAKKFSNLKKSVKKASVKSKKLKADKKYIFRVRTIKTVNGKKIYGAWVKTKAVKCK